MYTRETYLNIIKNHLDTPVIKVITGMRRVGKSTILKQTITYLEKLDHFDKKNIIYINKESIEFDVIKNYKDLHTFIKTTEPKTQTKKYIFVDEIQEIEEWEKCIISLFSEETYEIFITGSNSHLLSSELSTLISGRYIEIQILPLSYSEFIELRKSIGLTSTDFFKSYLKYGGLPAINYLKQEEDLIHPFIAAIFNTIILKDIVKRFEIRNISLLERITKFIFDNIGNIFSANKISDYLKSQKIGVGVETIQIYLQYLIYAYSIYKVPRYDIKGKRLLEINEKYYIGDIGLRHSILGYKESDISGLLENIIFLELKKRGYSVYIGKINDLEIDFIAEKNNEKKYIQVAYILENQSTIDREIRPLQLVRDNYPKYIISTDTLIGSDIDGIKRLNILDFLQNEQF